MVPLSQEERLQLPLEMRMYSQLYPPNEIRWRIGDYVIHDDDNKSLRMLMVVVDIRKDGTYLTKYAIPYEQPTEWRSRRWKNPVFKLHNPALFGIPVP